MYRPALALSLALLLPAAGAAAGAGSFDSLDEFARAVGMKKGGWRTRVKVTEAFIKPSPSPDPAHLAEVRARIEKMIGLVDEKDECAGTSSEGGPLLPGIVIEPGCSFGGMRAADGRWTLSCTIARSDNLTRMDSEGTYSRKKVTGRHEGDLTHKGVVIHVVAELESRWVGKCRPPKPIELIQVVSPEVPALPPASPSSDRSVDAPQAPPLSQSPRR